MNIPNRHIKIANPDDFKGLPKYIVVQKDSPVAHLQKKILTFKYEEVVIFHVEIASNRTSNPNDSGMYKTRFIGGAVLGGILGALLASNTEPVKWDIDFRIVLQDGRSVKVTVNDEVTVRILEPYTKISTWELEKFNMSLKSKKLAYEYKIRDKWEAEEREKRIEWQKQLDIKQAQMKETDDIREENEKSLRKNVDMEINKTLIDLKTNFEAFLEVCDLIDVVLWKFDPNQEVTSRQMMLYHFIKFCMYLSSPSENLSENDVSIINSLFNESYDSDTFIAFAEKENLNKNHYGSTIPPLLIMLISFEAPEINIQCVDQFIALHRIFASEFVKLTSRFEDSVELGISYARRLELYKSTVSYIDLNKTPDNSPKIVEKQQNDNVSGTSNPLIINTQTSEIVSGTSSIPSKVSKFTRRINIKDYRCRTIINHNKYGYGIIVSQLDYKIIVIFLDDKTVKFDSSNTDEFDKISITSNCASDISDSLKKKYSEYMKSRIIPSDGQPYYLQAGPEDFVDYREFLGEQD